MAKKTKGGVMKSVGKATGSSMKAMVHALQPKAVGLGEILDTWKIEQVKSVHTAVVHMVGYTFRGVGVCACGPTYHLVHSLFM